MARQGLVCRGVGLPKRCLRAAARVHAAVPGRPGRHRRGRRSRGSRRDGPRRAGRVAARRRSGSVRLERGGAGRNQRGAVCATVLSSPASNHGGGPASRPRLVAGNATNRIVCHQQRLTQPGGPAGEMFALAGWRPRSTPRARHRGVSFLHSGRADGLCSLAPRCRSPQRSSLRQKPSRPSPRGEEKRVPEWSNPAAPQGLGRQSHTAAGGVAAPAARPRGGPEPVHVSFFRGRPKRFRGWTRGTGGGAHAWWRS